MKVTKASKVLAVVAFLFSVYLSCARGQCPLIQGSELGRNDAASTEGLISDAFVAQSGDNPPRSNVLLFGYNIVCLATGGTRGTYSFVSVVANFSCTGPQAECNGEPLLSQIEFGCPESQWSPSIGGSTDNILTTPADGTLSTPVRTDCAICISPARSSFANENHCSPCDNCIEGVMMCTGRAEGLCCNFFNNSECVEQCPSPRIADANFDCVLDCGRLSDPVGGQVVMNGSTPGSVATYSCSAEFRLNGTSIRTCQTSGMWSESAPTCDLIDCGTLPDPNNGTVTLTGTRLGAEASYNCTEGFRINGTTNRTCQMDDEWSGSEPTCDLIDCGMLPDPNNGTVTLTGTGLGAEASYSCTEGFMINGTSNRVCEMDDEWSGSEPTCDLTDCGPLSDPISGTVEFTISTILGSQAFYRCMEGFLLNGNGVRMCQENGTWTGSDPACEPISCGGLSNPRNGNVSVPSTNFTSVATYDCEIGFNLVGQTTRRCLSSRIWSGFAPICEAVDCDDLQVSNGTVDLRNGTRFPAVAIYTCNRGYNISDTGDIVRTCLANGTWSGTPIECIGLPFPERVTVGPTPEPEEVDIAWIVVGICFFLLMILFVALIIGFGIYRSKED